MRGHHTAFYFTDCGEAGKYKQQLKRKSCPHCGLIGFLICHGYLKGYRDGGSKRSVRACRFFCSNRGRRGGCGRTFPVYFQDVLRRRQVSAPCFWRFILLVLRGMSRRAAWVELEPSFSLRHFYLLWDLVRRRQTVLREALCRLCAPPDSRREDPMLHFFEHLSCAFPTANCPIGAYQVHFQQSFLD